MGIKNGYNEGLNGGGKKPLGQGAGKSHAAGPRAEGVKNTDKLFLGNRWKTITAFNYPKFPILPSLSSSTTSTSTSTTGLLTNSFPARASSQKMVIHHYFVTLIAKMAAICIYHSCGWIGTANYF